jgi:hypothetical protein
MFNALFDESVEVRKADAKLFPREASDFSGNPIIINDKVSY